MEVSYSFESFSDDCFIPSENVLDLDDIFPSTSSPSSIDSNFNRWTNSPEKSTNSKSNPIPDDELSTLNIKDLNKKIKEKGLEKETVEQLKQRRRTLKNRKYATDCREKKDHEVVNLENAKDMEVKSIARLEERNQELRQKLYSLKAHYSKFIEFASKNNIQLQERKVQSELPETNFQF